MYNKRIDSMNPPLIQFRWGRSDAGYELIRASWFDAEGRRQKKSSFVVERMDLANPKRWSCQLPTGFRLRPSLA